MDYIVIVEVNVSQAVVIELIKSSLASIMFPLQLDNRTEITEVNVTTGGPARHVISFYCSFLHVVV